jgi:DNA replication protein DnaC
MLTHPLLPKLRELCLGGMVESLEERAALAQSQGLTPVEFLALLLEDEIERRHQRRFLRREREAGFESLRTLADFDFGQSPGAGDGHLSLRAGEGELAAVRPDRSGQEPPGDGGRL